MAEPIDNLEKLSDNGEEPKTELPSDAVEPQYLNDLSHAPTVFADGLIFVARLGSTVKLSFVETILEPVNGRNPGVKTKHVVNIAMPMEGFQNSITYVQSVLENWKIIDGAGEVDVDQSAH